MRKGALAAERILVNAVAPGACATGFTKGLPCPATRTAARPARWSGARQPDPPAMVRSETGIEEEGLWAPGSV